MTVLDRIHRRRSRRKPTLAIYVDLSKAYDTISHDKLYINFSTSSTSVRIPQPSSNPRRHSTHTQHAKSDFRTITHGIPQGSTLSPTLFILYINDIIKTVPNSKVYTYADDTTLVISAETTNALQQLAQSELNSLIKYFHCNNLVPNAGKTCFTVFYPRKADDINLMVADVNLEQTPQARLLGLQVQQELKFHKQITTIIGKLQPLIQSFRYANKLVSTTTMKQLTPPMSCHILVGTFKCGAQTIPAKLISSP